MLFDIQSAGELKRPATPGPHQHQSENMNNSRSKKGNVNLCLADYILLQPLRWCYVECVIHHERDVREEQ